MGQSFGGKMTIVEYNKFSLEEKKNHHNNIKSCNRLGSKKQFMKFLHSCTLLMKHKPVDSFVQLRKGSHSITVFNKSYLIKKLIPESALTII